MLMLIHAFGDPTSDHRLTTGRFTGLFRPGRAAKLADATGIGCACASLLQDPAAGILKRSLSDRMSYALMPETLSASTSLLFR